MFVTPLGMKAERKNKAIISQSSENKTRITRVPFKCLFGGAPNLKWSFNHHVLNNLFNNASDDCLHISLCCIIQ